MGKYKKGILGYFRGKVGTVIGSIWKGINYMKSLPDVSNSEPTPAQLAVRLKFALVIEFLSDIKGLINIGYQKFNKGITPMNAATSYHLKSAVLGISPNLALDYTKVIISVGDLEELNAVGVMSAPDSELIFSWNSDLPLQYGAPTDMVTFLVYAKTLNRYVQVIKVVPRSALTYTLTVPADFYETSVICYIMLTSADGKECSTSQIGGTVTVM
ncbi:MAG: hypothetical protein EOO85_10420 [Pedobacter sp.]|nr:MAG: hypothetical protein EOO85_10420 [Pedobacter sp.]